MLHNYKLVISFYNFPYSAIDDNFLHEISGQKLTYIRSKVLSSEVTYEDEVTTFSATSENRNDMATHAGRSKFTAKLL